MVSGNWYYYDGSEWTSGGVYNSSAINTDTTLSVSGMAADAKTAGDSIKDIYSRLKKMVTSSNYSTLLSDLNNAPIGSFYLLNFAASGNKPSNLPDSSIGYDMAMLFTLGDSPYRGQYLLNGGDLYSRIGVASSNTWQSWSKREFLLNGVKNAMITLVTTSNYSTVLSDCNNAPVNSVMILNFSPSMNKPANLPDSGADYSMTMLLTYGAPWISYKVQYCIDKAFSYHLLYS